MKGSLITCFFLLTVFGAHSQESLERILLDNGKPCTHHFTGQQISQWKHGDLKAKFDYPIRQAKLIRKCGSTGIEVAGKDTVYYLSDAILELKFDPTFAQCMFDSLVSRGTKQMNRSMSILSHYDKGGRIYGLRKKDNVIAMITVNACAEGLKLNKIVAYLRKNKKFDRLMVIPCGAQTDVVKVY